MNIKRVHLRNFRRFENVEISFEKDETIFVGPNNSGKTSATTAFRLFLAHQNFTIHDFSVSRIAEIDAFGFEDEIQDDNLPSIIMDIWFSLDPDIEFGRVFSLLPNISTSFEEVGIRLEYHVKDANTLRSEYFSAFPLLDDGTRKKRLSHYLSLQGNLKRHFSLRYFALENVGDEPHPYFLKSEEGNRTLKSLIRIDFVDAQRNIDDHEASRSNRLSTAFASFYKNNLQQPEVNEEANRVIDENNENLSKHYGDHFKDLMEVIRTLGVPSINDRKLRIISSLSPEEALQGNTSLLYIDPDHDHELPEAYNGLGFKNLIYIAIQIRHFHLQWINTKEKRPLCQIIFIEEPEVHLHAQVQQSFISNIWKIISDAGGDVAESPMTPQLVITTHSSHILDAVDFKKARYFKRCVLSGENSETATTLNASKILSLRDFKPQKSSASGEAENEQETLDFLKKYLKLTHCDLFFADAAVLVEGTVEKLLLPLMIENTAPGLQQSYLTTLEVGGAYANRFASLLEFLGVPYLVITDIDSVDPTNNRKVCRADTAGAVTSNAAIKFFLNKTEVNMLAKLPQGEHELADTNCFIAFQKPSIVEGHNSDRPMHGRTFEETFVYQNMQIVRDNEISLGVDFPDDKEFEKEYSAVFNAIKSSSFKKTEFALNVASSTANWTTPQYIADGLHWLERKMGTKQMDLVQ